MDSVLIKTSIKNEKYIIDKIIRYKINIINSYEKNGFLYIKLFENDYEKICAYDYFKEVTFVKYYGFNGLKKTFCSHLEEIIIALLIFLLMFLSKFIIISVNIHTSDENLKSIVKYYLMDNKIDNFTLKKSYKKLNIIKSNLLEKYSDSIEWVEISKNGYDYDIYLIKRKIDKKKDNSNDRCNYIAKKSGTITSVIAKTGVIMVQENNYVTTGDILISGSIIYNEELKDEVCATGKVMGEVWYKVDIEYPLIKRTKVPSNKKNYNLSFSLLNKKYKIFKDKYNHNKNIIHIGFKHFGFDIIKNYKTTDKKTTYTEKKATILALEKAKSSVLLKLPKGSKILSENILKKSINNDKIYLEVLITSEEELGVVEKY